MIKALVLLALLPGLALAQDRHGGSGHDATVRHDFDDIEKYVERFENPERDTWQKPVAVLDILGVAEGEHVADLGAGTGYFTSRLSVAVGRTGQVYAVDIAPAMLEYIQQRDDITLPNVETILADPDDPKLPEGELELVLVVNTWHHIDDRLNYLKRLRGSLLKSGRVAVIDFREGELPVGPPAGTKLSREAVIAEFEKGGWTLGSESVVLQYQYFLIFHPPKQN